MFQINLRSRCLILLGLFSLIPAPISVAATTPEAEARAYFAAMQEEGLTAATRFMHPTALAQFKSMLMPVYAAENAAGTRQLLDMTFSADMDFAELQALDPALFMDGFMNLLVAQTGNAPIRFDNLEVIGTVDEGEARHVLTRMTLGAGELAITQFEVLSFLPYEDTWRLQLDGDMKGLAAALRSSLPPPDGGN